MAGRKIRFIPVSSLPPKIRADHEKHGVFIGQHTDAELKAKIKAWKKHLRWPPRGVCTSELKTLPEHEQLYQMAIGYIQSSRSLCIELGEHPKRLSCSRGLVVYYLSRHAVELFLKACLLRKGIRSKTHEISTLQEAFHKELPNSKGILSMWDINIVELAQLGPDPGDRHIPSREDQSYRYFADTQGKPPPGTNFFTPATFIDEIERLRREFAKVWKSLAR